MIDLFILEELLKSFSDAHIAQLDSLGYHMYEILIEYSEEGLEPDTQELLDNLMDFCNSIESEMLTRIMATRSENP